MKKHLSIIITKDKNSKEVFSKSVNEISIKFHINKHLRINSDYMVAIRIDRKLSGLYSGRAKKLRINPEHQQLYKLCKCEIVVNKTIGSR